MKPKKILLFGENLLKWMLGFWLGETIFFLIIDGWHYKADSIAETYCDKISLMGIEIGLWIIVMSVYLHCRESILSKNPKTYQVDNLKYKFIENTLKALNQGSIDSEKFNKKLKFVFRHMLRKERNKTI